MASSSSTASAGWRPACRRSTGPFLRRNSCPGRSDGSVRGSSCPFRRATRFQATSIEPAYEALGIRSALVVPLSVDDRIEGAVGFNAVREERPWPPEVVHRLKVVAGVFAQLLARQRRDEALRAATAEAQRLKEQLQVGERVPAAGGAGTSGAEPRRGPGRRRAAGAGADRAGRGDRFDGPAAGRDRDGKGAFATQIHELERRVTAGRWSASTARRSRRR